MHFFNKLLVPCASKTLPLLAMALGLYALSSCTTSYYAPNLHNVPLLHEENEVSATVARNTYEYTVSTELQAAYSPIENYGVMLNASFFSPKQGQISGISYGLKGTLLEAAVGRYANLGENLVGDVYFGYGYLNHGSTNLDFFNSTSDPVFNSRFNYQRGFIQSSIGYKHEVFDFIFSLRGSYLQYSNIRNDSLPSNSTYYSELILRENENFFMLEPALTARIGYKYMKFQLQAGTTFNMAARDFAHDRLCLSVGVVFNIQKAYRGNFLPRFE